MSTSINTLLQHNTTESKTPSTALIVDDEKNIRLSIKLALEDININCLQAHDLSQALRYLKEHIIDVIVLDIQIGPDSGLDFFQTIRTLGYEQNVVFISGHASLDDAAKAVKLGAYDFIEKPFSANKIAVTVQRALEHSYIKNKVLTSVHSSFNPIIGDSKAIQSVQQQAIKVSKTNATVYISGETGVGKESIALLIHNESNRKNYPFVKVNCSAIPENLIESELFGYEKGAFTGADKMKKGFFELAHRGTIFLDEVADLSLAAQAKILRVLQEGEIQKLGSENIIKIDVRIISASHKNLNQECKKQMFREDLLFRLNVVPLHISNLSERTEDIPLLVHYFISEICKKNNLKEKRVDTEVIEILKRYSWPGNIRELKNILERMVIFSEDCILPYNLPEEIMLNLNHSNKNKKITTSDMSLKEFRVLSDRDFIIESLKKCNGNISKAALKLDIARSYLHKRMEQLKITKKDYLW